jgi:hypothetical protein
VNLLGFLIGSAVLTLLLPWLSKFGFGRMPGDLRWRMFGKVWLLPLGSLGLLWLGLWLMDRLLR